MLRSIRIAFAPLALLPFTQAAAAQTHAAPAWHDDYTTRLEALALLQTLNADLLSGDSATVTLDRWCMTHQLASPARIVAERIKGSDEAPTPEQRQILGVGPDEPVAFRRVRLKCGEHVLSEAENWYVPSRLTAEMNRLLAETDTPFGRAVKTLNFRRRTLSAKLLWSPLPKDWEMAGTAERSAVEPGSSNGALLVPHEVLEHRAVLSLPDGTPISQVVETYTGDVLAFPEPEGGASRE